MRGACRELIKDLTTGESSQGAIEVGLVVAIVVMALIVPVKSLAESFVGVARMVSLLISSI